MLMPDFMLYLMMGLVAMTLWRCLCCKLPCEEFCADEMPDTIELTVPSGLFAPGTAGYTCASAATLLNTTFILNKATSPVDLPKCVTGAITTDCPVYTYRLTNACTLTQTGRPSRDADLLVVAWIVDGSTPGTFSWQAAIYLASECVPSGGTGSGAGGVASSGILGRPSYTPEQDCDGTNTYETGHITSGEASGCGVFSNCGSGPPFVMTATEQKFSIVL